MTSHNFDIKRDVAIVNDGGFFCYACLVGKPANELSPDYRYCVGCFDFLLEEAKMDMSRRNGGWKPVVTSKNSPQEGQEQGR